MNTIRWRAGVRNGLLAWFIGFALYMIPAFVVAVRLAWEQGPRMRDSAATSAHISQEIATRYAHSWLLHVGLIVIVALLVSWRAWAVAKGSGEKRMANGLIVGGAAAVLTLGFLAWVGFGWVYVAAMLLYVGAGVGGGYLAKAQVQLVGSQRL